MDEILSVLKRDFGLRKNHILILEALQQSDNTAEALSRSTGIPLGRIYGFLHFLESETLIDKSPQHPAVYSFQHKQEKLNDFLLHRFDRFLDAEAAIAHLLEKQNLKEETKVIDTSKEYVLETFNMLKEGGELKIIVRNTSVCPDLYPFDKKEFLKVRLLVEEKRKKKQKTTLSSGTHPSSTLFMLFHEHTRKGFKIDYILTKQGVDLYFDILFKLFPRRFVHKIITEILARLHTYPNVKIHIVDDFIPYNLYLSPTRVQLVLTHGGGVLSGFASNNSGAVSVYSDLYESIKKRSRSIASYLQRKLKELA